MEQAIEKGWRKTRTKTLEERQILMFARLLPQIVEIEIVQIVCFSLARFRCW